MRSMYGLCIYKFIIEMFTIHGSVNMPVLWIPHGYISLTFLENPLLPAFPKPGGS